jgi:peptidoglycan/xylan/chitin deacetylase (PgdA/CDA1 family)/thymidylate kinase
MNTKPKIWIPALFAAWESSGIRYVVLRNFQSLPEDIGNDLDILVDPRRIGDAEDILITVLRRHDILLHNRAEFSPVSLFFHNPRSMEQFHVDLFRDLKWRGFDLVDAKQVLRHSTFYNTIRVPSDPDRAVINLLTRLVFGGYIQEKYKGDIKAIATNQSAEFLVTLKRSLGSSMAVKVNILVHKGDWGEIEKNVNSVQLALIFQAMKHPIRTAASILVDGWRLAKRWIRLPGLSIVLVGPDGCGKTSAAEELKKRLAGTFYEGYTRHLHWKPRLMKKKAEAANPFGIPCTDPHGKPPRSPLMNILYFLAHSLEIPPAWLLRVRPRLFRNMLVMIDRYYYDFMVDPKRYRMNVSGKWAWLVYRVMPKPNLVFCLSAPAAVIQARKSEVSLEETERQRVAYEKVTERLPCGYVVDANRPLEQVVNDMEMMVLSYLARRIAKRGPSKSRSVLILNYHRIVADKMALSGFFDVTANELDTHIKLIKKIRINPNQIPAPNESDSSSAFNNNSFLITFDDGTVDHYTVASDILIKNGVRGVFFVNTALLGQPGFLSISQCQDLVRQGHDVECHSHEHLNLAKMTPDQVRSQLRTSKAVLETNGLGKKGFFAPPGGRYNRGVIRLAREEGFSLFRTVKWGYNRSTSFEVDSVNITRHTAGFRFARMIIPKTVWMKSRMFELKEVVKNSGLQHLYFWVRDSFVRPAKKA